MRCRELLQKIFSEQAKELIAFYWQILEIPFIETDNDNKPDLTMERLNEKGVPLSEAIRYDWGTYEVRLNDIDENEIVIVGFT